MNYLISLSLILTTVLTVNCLPHSFNPFYNYYRYDNPFYNSLGSYASHLPTYSNFIPTYTNNLIEDTVASSYITTPDVLPTLNILAEVPYTISNQFTVVPMLVVSKENMHTLSNAHIMSVSKKKPLMMVKTDKKDSLIPCTPAVRILLEKPIVVYSLKTDILFPSEVQIVHEGYSIPIRVGAVIAPVHHDTFVSTDTPVSINIVYAVPTKPIRLDYVNNDDAVIIPDQQAVIVDTVPELFGPPKNITVVNFPEKEAEPSLVVDEEDEELVNRNPPIVLAPAGIVQSTQPQTSFEPFINSKESPVLIALREEAKKRIK